MRCVLVLVVLVGVLLLSGPASAEECAPAKMVKIVFHNASPGLDAKSFEAQPRTLYRLGTKYGRMEDPLDAKNGVRGVIIAAEPDVWLIDLQTKSGEHTIDPDKPYLFRAQAFVDPDMPEELRGFEFGCEVDFMKGRKVQPKATTDGGRKLDAYTFSSGDHVIHLAVLPGTTKPVQVSLTKNDKVELLIRYDQYDANLAPDMRLFGPPKDIAMNEPAKPQAPPQPTGSKP